MLNLQTIADSVSAQRLTSDETLDLFVEAAMLAPANAVRVSGLVRKRLHEAPAIVLHAEINGVEFVLGEASAMAAMNSLCAEARHDCNLHLVSIALNIGAAIIEAKGALRCMAGAR